MVSSIKKRLMAVFLCLCVFFQLIPGMSAAALDDKDTKDTPELMTVETEYLSIDREQAKITFHKEGIKNDGINFIMLVDVSKGAAKTYPEFVQMMKENGAGYIFDQSMDNMNVRMLAYQNIVNQDTGFMDGKEGFLRVFEDHGVSGEGNPDEVKALSALTNVLQNEISNDLPTVVLWVPGQMFGQSDDAIEAELQKMKQALGDDDTFITWELGDQPRDLLVKYASTYTIPHEPEKGEISAAYARGDADSFREDMALSLEQVVHDHYHNIHVPLKLKDGQTVVDKIVDVEIKSYSSQTDIEYEIAADGQSVDLHIIHLCRQVPVEIILTVDLNTASFVQEDVIEGTVFTIPDDGTNGGLHSGIFDENVVENLSIQIPTAQVDRRQYTVTYLGNGAQGTVSEVKRMPGQLVAIPDDTDLSKEGENFGGWNVTSVGEMEDRHLTAGEIIPMPAQDLELTAAWGHLEVELEINHTQGGKTYGNKMMQSLVRTHDQYGTWDFGYDEDFGPLDFAYAYNPDYYEPDKPNSGSGIVELYDKNGEAIGFRIKSIVFDDEFVRVDHIVDKDDPLKVNLPDIPQAVYAREIGATEDDLVVAYLIPWAEGSEGDLQLVISGPGGVTAPDNCRGLFLGNVEYPGVSESTYESWPINVEEIKLNDVFYVDEVTDMSYMFSYLRELTVLDLGDNFNTSNVQNMESMFGGCPKLQTLDLGTKFDTSKVTNMDRMFAGLGGEGGWSLAEPDPDCSALTSVTLGNYFDTSNVQSMKSMFQNNISLVNLALGDNFDTSSVTDMSNMFSGCLELQNLDLGTQFDTGNVTSMDLMFQFCKVLDTNALVKDFDVASIETMDYIFHENNAVTTFDLSSWANDNVITSLYGVFADCANLESVILGDNFNTQNVTSTASMFLNDGKLKSIDFGTGFDTRNVTSFTYMFRDCVSLTDANIDNWNVSQAVMMKEMFYRCESLPSLDLSGWNCENIQNIDWMFAFMHSATKIKPPNFDFRNQKYSLERVFSECRSVESLDVSGWTGLENITSMIGLFDGCSSATRITLGGEWAESNFQQLGSMQYMFWGCASLTELDLGGWTLPNLTNVSGMFGSCRSLRTLDLSWKSLPTNTELLSCDGFFANLDTDTTQITVTVQDANGIVDEKSKPALKKMLSDKGAGSFSVQTVPENFLTDTTASNQMLNAVTETMEQPGEVDQPEAPEQPGEANQPEAPEQSGEVDQPEVPEQSGEVDQPEAPEQSGEVDQPEAPEQSGEVDQPEAPEQSGEVDQTETPEQAESSPVASRMQTSVIKTMPIVTADPGGVVEDNPEMVAVSDSMDRLVDQTPPGSTVTYRVTVKYVGDIGAKSGLIEMAFPIPEYMVQDPDEVQIDISDIKYTDVNTGFIGGRVVTQPYLDDSDPDNPVLRGTFEGLYAGTEIEIDITCNNERHDFNTDGYMFWDGTAYARGDNASATSKTIRLWYTEAENPTPPDTPEYRVEYQFEGDLPSGVDLPPAEFHEENANVITAASPLTPELEQLYTFTGWVRKDTSTDVTPGDSFTMPKNDVILVGTWELREENIPKLTVEYQYNGEVPPGAPSIGSGADDIIKSPQTYFIGNNHTIVKVANIGTIYTFPGWIPSLKIQGENVPLTPMDNGKLYQGIHDGHNFVVDMSGGVLFTSQFEDVATKNASDVVVTFTGTWDIKRHDIQISVEGGTAEPNGTVTVLEGEDQKIQFTPNPGYVLDSVTVDGKSDTIQPDGSYLFENVTGDHTIHVVYKPKGDDTHQITVTVEGGTAEPGGVIYVPNGEDQKIQFKPNPGYELDSVTVDGVQGELQPDGSYVFENVTGDHTIHVVYKPKDDDTHQITVTVEGGTAEPGGVIYVPNGEDQKIQFKPNPGYELDSVTVDGVQGELQPDGSYVFDNVTSNHTIHVVYKKPSTPDGGSGGGGSTPPKYTLTYESNGGTPYPDESYDKGTEIDIDKTPVREGYTFDGWYLDKELTQKVTQVTMDKDITVYAKWIATDIPEDLNGDDHFAYVIGYPDGSVRPQGNITRAEVATIFFRLLTEEARQENLTTENSFEDISSINWYNTAISTMEAMGIVTGYSDGKFHANQPITRAEFAAIAARFDSDEAVTGQIFTDIAGHWAEPYILKAAHKGWILGQPDGTFAPDRYITRAEAMTLINRVLKRLPETPDDLLEGMNEWPDNMNQDAWYYLAVQEATNSHDHVYHDDNVYETWTAMKEDPDWEQYEK